MMKSAQALALYEGADFVTPDHIQELAEAVLAHRLTLAPEARYSGRTGAAVVREVLDRVPVPR
jgi:MoxR-like ATPase